MGCCVPSIVVWKLSEGRNTWGQSRAWALQGQQNRRSPLLMAPPQLCRPTASRLTSWPVRHHGAHSELTSRGCSPASCQPGWLGSTVCFMAASLGYGYISHYYGFYASQGSWAKGKEEPLKGSKPHISGSMEKDQKTNLDGALAMLPAVSPEFLWGFGSRVSSYLFSLSALPSSFLLVPHLSSPREASLCTCTHPEGALPMILSACARSRAKSLICCCGKVNLSWLLSFVSFLYLRTVCRLIGYMWTFRCPLHQKYCLQRYQLLLILFTASFAI